MELASNYVKSLPDLVAELPGPTVKPQSLLWGNDLLAEQIGLPSDWLGSLSAKDIFSGDVISQDQSPAALAYAGHQFGHFNPQLGDGRALLLGEYDDPQGAHWDIHLKGSGITPFSRRGDGKATLRAALKECLFSEYLSALNIPTTRSLAVYGTGETVIRQISHPGAILVRLAKSHIRVGTFEYAARIGQGEWVKSLADYLIEHIYPDISGDNLYRQTLAAIIQRQASLLARWMAYGFIHGVMNTDNMALSGESIDFGPCAFMEKFLADQVFSSIDRQGRYAWNRQPNMAIWNLSRLAETFLPYLASDEKEAIQIAEAELEGFTRQFKTDFETLMMKRLGLDLKGSEASEFLHITWSMLETARPDYTFFFRHLASCQSGDGEEILQMCEDQELFRQWLYVWRQHLTLQDQDAEQFKEASHKVNPAFVLRLQAVERALEEAEAGDMQTYDRLIEMARSPFEPPQAPRDLWAPTSQDDTDLKTFCET